jgi:RNA-directed DNA polymerase
LEPAVDPLFHPDSYGYRPGKSALDAVGQARQRCWCYDWIIDLDIKGFFDNIPLDLLLRAVRKHAKGKWMVLYIERWLKAPVQEEDGRLVVMCRNLLPRHCHELLPQISQNLARYAHLFTRATLAEMG